MRNMCRAACTGRAALAVGVLLAGVNVAAQTPAPPATAKKPDDAPSVRLGATIFADYTVTTEPKAIDVDGNEVTANAFNIARSYINVTGQISRLVAFRVTPDIA